MSKAKRKLIKVHFDFDNAHLAYTEKSQGGAASLKNDPYLLKSVEVDKSLSANQKRLLNEMGYEVSEEVDKSMTSEKNSGLSSPDGASQGEQPENKTNEGNEMSAEILKQLEDLKRELAVEKAVNAVSKYELEATVANGLAQALASLKDEEKASVIKALDSLVAKTEEAVTKAVEVEKANKVEEKKENENPILKGLSEEQGHSEKGDTGVEKSKIDKIKEETEKLVNKATKGA